MMFKKPIQQIDLSSIVQADFKQCHANCIVLSKDNKILLQQRPLNWWTAPGCLSTFGGHIEINETPMQALVRELKEELGAQVKEEDVVILGAITEAITNHSELIYVYFWHDKQGTITGCYECLPMYYDNVTAVKAHPKVMDYVLWSLSECESRGLL